MLLEHLTLLYSFSLLRRERDRETERETERKEGRDRQTQKDIGLGASGHSKCRRVKQPKTVVCWLVA